MKNFLEVFNYTGTPEKVIFILGIIILFCIICCIIYCVFCEELEMSSEIIICFLLSIFLLIAFPVLIYFSFNDAQEQLARDKSCIKSGDKVVGVHSVYHDRGSVTYSINYCEGGEYKSSQTSEEIYNKYTKF